jgi:hypothetical protein
LLGSVRGLNSETDYGANGRQNIVEATPLYKVIKLQIKERVMDHKQKHHEHHQKEREQEQKQWKEHNRQLAGKRHTIHPAWYVVVGVVLVGAAVLVWTFVI